MFNEEAFRAAIKAKGENIEMAAKVMGINKVTLYRKMAGESDFYRKEMQLFCSYYGVKAASIFFAKQVTET